MYGLLPLLQYWRLIATVAVLAGSIYGGWWLRGYVERVDDLRASNATLRKDLQAAHQTAEVMRAHHARMQREAADYTAVLEALNKMDGQNAPLSDLLRATAGRLWP